MPRYLFVTGKLAAQSLASTLEKMSPDFEYELAVLPISVAALMDTHFVAKHLDSARGSDVVMIPGLCKGDLSLIADKVGAQVVRGPKDLKDIPAAFGQQRQLEGYGEYRTKILAEIVDAYQLSLDQILTRAEYFRASGADIIDLGCPVKGHFPNVGEVVAALKARGFAVSIDTFEAEDILQADRAGVDYLLSVNSRNIELAPRLACKVVVIPDFDQGLESLEHNIAQLEAKQVPYIIDPILNPISFGFTESVTRFYETRRRHPQAEMLMGVGNLTELTGADSTGINAVMAGIIAELDINYVLTTEVISWARGAVRELDVARKLMHYACTTPCPAQASGRWPAHGEGSAARALHRRRAARHAGPGAGSKLSHLYRRRQHLRLQQQALHQEHRSRGNLVAAGRRRCLARVLPGPRAAKGGAGRAPGQTVHAGNRTALGLPGRRRAKLAQLMTRKPKDRDFVETPEGLLFCVVGYLHPPDKYTAYLKYSPAAEGRWQRQGTAYHRELAYYHAHQVGQTLDTLQAHYPGYIHYCPVRDMTFSMVPHDRVRTYYTS